jgi:cell division protein FtsN
MTEVVSSIRRVTDIMGEISAASSEQSNGVNQVGEAVRHMDQATQQNAALVEEMAAAASSLKSQAQELVGLVSTFKINTDTHATLAHHEIKHIHVASAPKAAAPRPLPKPVAAAPKPKPVAAPQVASAPKVAPKAAAAADDDWETF